ncbi:MAG: hypothetical protein ACI8W8_001407 [Rhodothermales bacterium]|jgi:hypothetical protein
MGLFRGLLVGGLAVGLGLSSLASWRGMGLNRLDRSIQQSVRNQSVFGPWFSGRGFHGGK